MVSDSVKKILEAEKNGEQKNLNAEKKAREIVGKANLAAQATLQNAREEAAKEAAAEQKQWQQKTEQKRREIESDTARRLENLEREAVERYEQAVAAAVDAITD